MPHLQLQGDKHCYHLSGDVQKSALLHMTLQSHTTVPLSRVKGAGGVTKHTTFVAIPAADTSQLQPQRNVNMLS
jgi:hypothetical protein